jgi:O-acetyl-ADP-ribose deacetylase (regulator of RNase III)
MVIHLVDRNAPLTRAWNEAFEDVADVEIHQDDFFAVDADAMVSPANSFGIMDGGLDLAIRDQLGFAVEKAVQRAIVERHHGELPIGSAEVVPTGHARWPYLIAAPTMRVPEHAGQTLNAYMAFRAVLLAAARVPEIRSIVCPGLCTGIGGMEPRRCAIQMKMALRQVTGPARIPSFSSIHAIHAALRSA